MKPYHIPYLYPLYVPPGPTSAQVGDALAKLIATARKNPQNNKL